MNTDDLTPPMFPMQPAFEHIGRVGKIRIIHERGETIGELIPTTLPHKKLFGARIDIIHPPVYHTPTGPQPLAQWTTVGHIPVTTYKCPLEWLEKIEVSNDQDIPYTLKV